MTQAAPVLYGRLLSPYVRRIAVTMHILEMPFTLSPLSAIGDEAARERINPVGRVPAMRLPSGEVLVDSAAILDHLDEVAGEGRALIPPSGAARRRALRHLAIATGAIDRAMTANAENRREVPDAARRENLLRQCRRGFTVLEAEAESCFGGARLMQTGITTAIGYGFVNHIFPGTLDGETMPRLAGLAARCEAMEPFRAAAIDAAPAPG